MSEILKDIIYCCGIIFIILIGFAIISWIISKIIEITYDAHQNLIGLRDLKEKYREARDEIENIATYDGIYIDRAYVLDIMDKLIESEET